MPSRFLNKRLPEAVVNTGGADTVRLISFNESARDASTGDVDEAAAYSATPVALPALIDLAPSDAKREQFGKEVEFEATLLVTAEHFRKAEKTLAIGDVFLLPHSDDKKWYVKKIIPSYQSGREFTAYEVAIGRRVGRM